MEKTLVEIKAKIQNLELIRKKIVQVNANKKGKFHQFDTYFNVAKGRLKLREIKEKRNAQLIYYDRENTSEPKKSKILMIEISTPKELKKILRKTLGVKTTVKKIREIYDYQGIKIHLDRVEGLGTFLEFEKETLNNKKATEKGGKDLKELLQKLGIPETDLLSGSYSDIKNNTIT
jgi:predicted adenylyl cyclase CyaB